MKLVCDTNVLVAALVSEGLCRDIVKRRLPQHQLFTSAPLLRELERVLRTKFSARPLELPLLKAYRERATIVAPARLARRVSRDPDDDVVLATALAAEADLIITGDEDLLVLRNHEGIAIVSPRGFLEALDRR